MPNPKDPAFEDTTHRVPTPDMDFPRHASTWGSKRREQATVEPTRQHPGKIVLGHQHTEGAPRPTVTRGGKHDGSWNNPCCKT